MRNIRLGGLAVVVLSAGVAPAADAAPGPLMRAALAIVDAEQANSSAPRSEEVRDDWSRVIALSPGAEIILTTRGSRAMTHRLLRADGDGLLILDVSGASLPQEVRRSLVGIAADRPFILLEVQAGFERQLSRRVRLSPEGVFFEQQHVADLSDILKTVSRHDVADLRVRRKHVGSHTRRGLLIGAAIGAGVAAAVAVSDAGDAELGLVGAGALFGGVYGLGVGSVVGLLAPPRPDVIYHVD